MVGSAQYRNVSVTNNVNAGTQQITGINISGSLVISKKLEFRSSIMVFDKYIVSGLVAGNTSNTFNYRINANFIYQISKTLAVEFFGNFRSPRTDIQGSFPSYSSYSIAARKYFLNRKLSIAFTTNNPFNYYTDQETNITGQNFSNVSLRRIPNQSFGLSVSYKFGKMEYKERRQDREPNDTEEKQ